LANPVITSRKITKNLKSIEKNIQRKLTAFYNTNIKGSISPIEVLRRQYDKEIRTMIRVAVERGYMVGINVVGDQINDKDKEFQLFISATDINNIQALTDRLSNDFWQRAQRLHQRENEFIQKGDVVQAKAPLDIIATMIGIAAGIAFAALNNAIRSKISEVPLEDSVIAFMEDGEAQIRPIEGRVIFLTQEDQKVDPKICEPLNRTEYDANDPDIPEPPLHVHCRCRLVPIIE
jgi:hypothetical protein